ncbi:hypothetical protein K435DRAFT_875367 [Dendrothele bispora CBS 962.96]|uniref:C2 domain-containing protein n=1 Tax=Dendrothele bispora (strain CBS 962.96) TaxID=1314807 RepID=A0A4V4HBJ2_DENBC|nr:hypothetical protein K435DRAFT_875367 [Dendrothele bispora CBS 962.96]
MYAENGLGGSVEFDSGKAFLFPGLNVFFVLPVSASHFHRDIDLASVTLLHLLKKSTGNTPTSGPGRGGAKLPTSNSESPSMPTQRPDAQQSASSSPLPSTPSKSPSSNSRLAASKATQAKLAAAKKQKMLEGDMRSVILPVVARNQGLEGHFETADGDADGASTMSSIPPVSASNSQAVNLSSHISTSTPSTTPTPAAALSGGSSYDRYGKAAGGRGVVASASQGGKGSFVDAVRISDIGQGSNPFHEEWINQCTTLLQKKKEEDAKNGIDSDQTGDYVNYEVAFAYQTLPGHGSKLKEKNIHLLIEFFLGIYDWLRIPVLIWIQVEGIVGTIRLRLQFIPEYPYVRHLYLHGRPRGRSVRDPLVLQTSPNVLNLPLISKFMKMAIKAGTAELVAPKSMTINLQELLSGSVIGGGSKSVVQTMILRTLTMIFWGFDLADTRAKGVFLITIHHTEGLSAQDSNGRSDPYIVLAYAKTAALLVSDDEIRAGEDVSLMLWDSDWWSNDDLIGRVQIPVKTLINELPKNQMMRREDKFMGFEDADHVHRPKR